jgi:hypothetical protein
MAELNIRVGIDNSKAQNKGRCRYSIAELSIRVGISFLCYKLLDPVFLTLEVD